MGSPGWVVVVVVGGLFFVVVGGASFVVLRGCDSVSPAEVVVVEDAVVDGVTVTNRVDT